MSRLIVFAGITALIVTGYFAIFFERGEGPLRSVRFVPAALQKQAEAALMQAKSFSVVEESGEGASKKYLVKTIRVETPGAMTPVEYNVFVRDLVNFLVWMGEPAQLVRKQIGIVVLFFLALLILLTWLLKKEFWKDVH